MFAAVETLESRTLMSTTLASLSDQVFADAAAVKVSVAAETKTSAKDQHTLSAALHPVSKANAALIKTLAGDYKAALANVKFMEKITGIIGLTDTKRAELAVGSALEHKLSAKTVAKMNVALGALSAEDVYFNSAPVFNAFYAAVAVPGTEEMTIGSSNPNNAALQAALPAIEADAASLTTTLYTKFNTEVMDISALATAIVNNVPGAVF